MRLEAHRRFGLVLVLVASLHGAVLVAAPDRALFGDENDYLAFAIDDAEHGDTWLLPGALRADWQPQLASRFYARFVEPDRTHAEIVRTVAWAQLVLLLAVLAFTYAHALLLGLGRGAATLAAALLGVFPWFGFYVHALWPEILHAFFFGAMLLGLQAWLVRGRTGWLAAAGAAAGFALLTKAVVNLLLGPAIVFVAAVAHRRGAGAAPGRRAAGAALACAAFAGPLLLVALPQLVANERATGHYQLASNRWINLELGLMRPLRSDDPAGGREIYDRYFADRDAGHDPEAGSRERVLDHLRSTPPADLLADQLARAGEMLFVSDAFLERAQTQGHWGRGARWLAVANGVARPLFYALLIGGLVGAALSARRNAGFALLALVLAYFAVAVLVVPLKIRFLMPVVPVCCLLTGAIWDRVTRSRRADGGASDAAES